MLHPGQLSKVALEGSEQVPVRGGGSEECYDAAGMLHVQLQLQAPQDLKSNLPEPHLIQRP